MSFKYEFIDNAEQVRAFEDRLKSLERMRLAAEQDVLAPSVAGAIAGGVSASMVVDPATGETITGTDVTKKRLEVLDAEIATLRAERDKVKK